MKSQQVTESLSKDRKSFQMLSNQLRKHSITPIRQMEVNRNNVLSQINKTRSRAVSQAQNHNFDNFNDTIQTKNNKNKAGNENNYDYEYDYEKDSQFKSAINTVYIQLSTKNGKIGLQESRPSDLRETSNNMTMHANVNNAIQTIDQNQRQDNETDVSIFFNDHTKKLSGVHGRVDITHEPTPKIIDEPGSPVLSSSSIETIKQENKIELNTRNKTDLKNLKKSNLTTLKNIKKMYAELKYKDSGPKKKNKMCLSSPAIDPPYKVDHQQTFPNTTQYNNKLPPHRQKKLNLSPHENAIHEVQFKNKFKNGSYEDVEAKPKDNFEDQGTHGQRDASNLDYRTNKGKWIKTQNLQNLIELNNVNSDTIMELNMNSQPKAIPKTTQNKFKKQIDSNNQMETFRNLVAVTQHNDQDVMASPTDKSFQEFNHFEEQEEERGIDTFSAFEPYSTIINQKSKQKVPLNTLSKRQLNENQHKKDFHDNLSLLNEHQKLIKQQKDFLKICKSDFVPCLFLHGNSDKVLLHFHANGEDIGQTQPLMRKINSKLRINIICMEYPGYGLYEEADGLTKKQQRSKQIQKDAEVVFKFVRDKCGVSENNIIIMGRSIGSGPACHLASKFQQARGLILISPIKSVKEVARQNYGRIVDLLIEERFDNFEVAKKIKCPVLIYHGIKDTMVPYQHSIEMLIQGFLQSEAHMFLRQDMEHNKFDYINDIIRPMKYFFRVNRILTTQKKRALTDNDVAILRQDGYVDKKAQRFFQHLGMVSRSHYFNNFTATFKPQMPKKNSKGAYIIGQNHLEQQHVGNMPNPLLDQNKVLQPILACDIQEDVEITSPLKLQKPHTMNLNDKILPAASHHQVFQPQILQQDQPPISSEKSQKELEERLNELQLKFEEQFNLLNMENYRTQKKSSEKMQSKQQMQLGTRSNNKLGDFPIDKLDHSNNTIVEDSQRVDTNEEMNQADAQDDQQNVEIIEVPGLTNMERKQIRKLLKESIKASIQSISCQSEDSFLTSSVVINDEFKATMEGRQLMDRIQMSNNMQPIQDMSNLNKQLKQVASGNVAEYDVQVPMSFVQIDKQMQNHIITAPKSKLISQNETDHTLLHSDNLSQEEDCVQSEESNNKLLKDDEEPTLKKVPGKLMTPFKSNNQQHDSNLQQMVSIKSQIKEKLQQRDHSNNNTPMDFSQISLPFKINQQFFRTPLEQIKDEKKQVEECLKAVKLEQNKFKNKEVLKPPMINRFNVSQVHVDEKLKENYKSIKSHRMTPNIYLGRDASADRLLDDWTDRTLHKRTNLSKNVEPKSSNFNDFDPVSSFQNEIGEEINLKSPNDLRNYHSTNESHDKKYPQIQKLLNSSFAKQANNNYKRQIEPGFQERITFGESEKDQIIPPQSTNIQTKMNLKNRHKYMDHDDPLKCDVVDQNDDPDDEQKGTIWHMAKQGHGVKSKKYFEDLVKISKKNSMKVLKNKQSQKSAFLENSENDKSDIKIHKKLQHSMFNVNEVSTSPKKPDIKMNGKLKSIHHQKQSISNFMNTSNSEILLPNSMPANKTIEHRQNGNIALAKLKKNKRQQSPNFDSINENFKGEVKPKSLTPVKSATKDKNYKNVFKKNTIPLEKNASLTKLAKVKPQNKISEKLPVKKTKNTNKPMSHNFNQQTKVNGGRINKFRNRFVRPPISNPSGNELLPMTTGDSAFTNGTISDIQQSSIVKQLPIQTSPREIRKKQFTKIMDPSPPPINGSNQYNKNDTGGVAKKMINSKTFRVNSNSNLNQYKNYSKTMMNSGNGGASASTHQQQSSLITKSSKQKLSSFGIDQSSSAGFQAGAKDPSPFLSELHTTEHILQQVNSPEMKMFQKYFDQTRRKTATNKLQEQKIQNNNNPYGDTDQPLQHSKSVHMKVSQQHGKTSRQPGGGLPSPRDHVYWHSPRGPTAQTQHVPGRSLSQLSDSEIDKRIKRNKQKVQQFKTSDNYNQ